VLRTKVDPQPTLWEAMLPEAFRRLPPGLCAIDRLLDDPVFFEPFAPYFDPYYGAAVDPDRDLSPSHAPEVPLPPRLREPVGGGDRLAQLAAVLSHRAL
jgi:hypothetical protein